MSSWENCQKSSKLTKTPKRKSSAKLSFLHCIMRSRRKVQAMWSPKHLSIALADEQDIRTEKLTAKGVPPGPASVHYITAFPTSPPTFTQGGPNPSACCSVPFIFHFLCVWFLLNVITTRMGKQSLCSVSLINLRLCLWLTLFLCL